MTSEGALWVEIIQGLNMSHLSTEVLCLGKGIVGAEGKGCSFISGEIHIIRSGMAMDQYPLMQTLIQTWSGDAVTEEVEGSFSLPNRSKKPHVDALQQNLLVWLVWWLSTVSVILMYS